MPRDSGGIGKTGKKHKKALVKWQSKEKGAASSVAAAAAASTNDDELEERAEAAAGVAAAPAAADAALTSVTETKTMKRVRFADLPPRVEGRFALPRSQGWTWGRYFDHTIEHFREVTLHER